METHKTIQTQQWSEEAVEPLSLERNSIIVEDWFRQIELDGKLAAVLLFNLLTSESERYRDIGQHILKSLYPIREYRRNRRLCGRGRYVRSRDPFYNRRTKC